MFLPFASGSHVPVLRGLRFSVNLVSVRVVKPATLFFSHAQLVYKPTTKLSVSAWDNCCVVFTLS